MKNKLFTLAAALTLAAVIGSIYAAPALAAVIKAALIKNVDEKGRTPFVVTLECTVISGSSNCTGTAGSAIPSDSRFVVEHVNGIFDIANSANISILRAPQSSRQFGFVPRSTTNGFSSTYYVLNEPFLAYYAAGATPSFEMFLSANASVPSLCKMHLIGYLIDLTI